MYWIRCIKSSASNSLRAFVLSLIHISVADLASTMSLRVENVWQQVDGTEVLTKVTDVKPGDRIVIRTGGMIPLEGRVVEGEALSLIHI